MGRASSSASSSGNEASGASAERVALACWLAISRADASSSSVAARSTVVERTPPRRALTEDEEDGANANASGERDSAVRKKIEIAPIIFKPRESEKKFDFTMMSYDGLVL